MATVPRMSHGYSVTVESEGESLDRELLQLHMEEYGMVKDVKIGRENVVVTFYEEESAHRAWVHLGGYESPLRLAHSTPDGPRGRRLDVAGSSRKRSRSRLRDTWCRRRASSMSPTPRKETERSTSDRDVTLRERSRSLQQLVGSLEHMFD